MHKVSSIRHTSNYLAPQQSRDRPSLVPEDKVAPSTDEDTSYLYRIGMILLAIVGAIGVAFAMSRSASQFRAVRRPGLCSKGLGVDSWPLVGAGFPGRSLLEFEIEEPEGNLKIDNRKKLNVYKKGAIVRC